MRPRSLMSAALAAVIAASATGCASIVAPGPDYIPVNSAPQGASLKLDGHAVGKTPTVVPVTRSSQGVLTFELEGFETKTVDVDRVLNGWFLGNVLWFPLWPAIPVGMAVDVAAGNAGKYPEKPIHVELAPVRTGALSVSE